MEIKLILSTLLFLISIIFISKNAGNAELGTVNLWPEKRTVLLGPQCGERAKCVKIRERTLLVERL